MTRKKGSAPDHRATAAGRSESYLGHEIFFPSDERRRLIFIDGLPVHYGIAGDEFYLDVYAYDGGKTLEEVIKRYLDYRVRTDKRECEEETS